MRVVYTCNCLA